MTGMSGGPPATHDDWTFELRGLRGRGFIRAGTMGDWQMKRVRREGVDVTDTPFDFATDLDGLEIELTQRLTTVSGGVSHDRGGVALDSTVVVFADNPGSGGLTRASSRVRVPISRADSRSGACRPAGIWRLPWDTWSLAKNRIPICSRHGFRVERPSRCRRARRGLSI